MASRALDAVAAPLVRWLRARRPSSRAAHASRAGHSGAARGGAIADELATAQTRPGRPGGSVRFWGSLRLATRLVVADEA